MDKRAQNRLRRLALERDRLIWEREALSAPQHALARCGDLYRVPHGSSCLSFQKRCQADGWIDPDFDWMTWMQSEEYAALSRDLEALETAGPGELIRLLTATIRQEKYTYGALEAALRSGLLQRITERAATLAC